MTTSRNEFGHYVQHNTTIYCSQHIEQEPNISADRRLIDSGWLLDEKLDTMDFIRDLQQAMATDRLLF